MLLNFTPITAAINHLLAQEPRAQRQLAAHAGKIARIDMGALVFIWQCTEDGLLQSPEVSADETVGESTDAVVAEPNVTIRLKLSDFPLIAQNRERAFSYVKIEGDADFANAISQVAQSVRWDAEHDLSKLVGDIAAVRLVGVAKTVVATGIGTHQKIAENLAEYFLEEQPMLVRPSAVEDFTDDVTKLRDDVERMLKRIERIERLARGSTDSNATNTLSKSKIAQ
ncbi:MAG: sterol-binding protein [Glaciimonas sp.]|nr:sterol-binding protein [Glaciimonas sp.]